MSQTTIIIKYNNNNESKNDNETHNALQIYQGRCKATELGTHNIITSDLQSVV